jgi:anti-sigma factor (TIGR02949 family)
MKKSENCRHLLSSLSDYMDGELGEELCNELERHLADCQDCQIVVDTLRKTITLYRATSTPPPIPTDVRERLYKRLHLDDFLSKEAPEGR